MNVVMSGSGKALINNVTSTVYNEGATGYDGGFLFKGSPDGTATLTNIACYFHSVGGESGTSTAATISQITGSTIDNFYSEGYKIGLDLRAISSSVSNVHTLLKTDGGYAGNECSFKLLGDQNILTDNIFEIDKAHQDSDPVVKILEGTHTFQNNRFRSAAATGQYLISGSTNVSASLINNIYEIADASYITASNINNITTGFIDGRGNWHRSQTTSSFDHIEATTFKGDGSGLSNLPASNPFPFTGDAQITGSLIISASATSQSLSVIGSGSTVFNVIGSEGTLFAIEDDLDGTLFTVNDRSGIPMFEVSASGRIVAEEGESIIRSQRPMVTHTTNFSITSSLDFAGKYHTIGGDLTCSINTGSLVPAGAEFEFFQTSSAGNFLFITGGLHVDLIAKNDNRNLAGRGSGATLKYIGGSTFHLVGDLT
jgi:hypothetical protein